VECSQFILEFPISPDYSFDSFIAKEKNRLIVQEIRNLKARPQHSLTITGEAGVGKTHLLKAAVNHFQDSQQGQERGAVYLDMAALVMQLQKQGEESLGQLLARYGTYSLVAVDDLEQLKEQPLLQEAVLFLFNQVRSSGGKLLFASRISPKAMKWLREDLSSRLLWGELLALTPPSDEELGEILAKMALDRQVRLSPELIKFLQLRLPRRVPDYAEAMARLDRAAMGLQHRITVPLAKKVLNM
jgi:DnaA-homolog protein